MTVIANRSALLSARISLTKQSLGFSMINLNRFAILMAAALFLRRLPAPSMRALRMRSCGWISATLLAILPTACSTNGVGPEELAMLGMRVILQEDDGAFVRFYALTTDNTEAQVRRTAVREYRRGLDEIMAASIKDANGGRSLHQVVTEARHRINCAPVPASKVSDPHGDGAETVTVRVRCMFPEIRHIEDGTPPDVADDELVPGTNRSWASYLQDLGGPAVVAIDFKWTLLRTPGPRARKWQVYPHVFETNMMIADLALSPRSLPGGTANHLNSKARGTVADEGLEQRGDAQE